jgi:hypothetical protein
VAPKKELRQVLKDAEARAREQCQPLFASRATALARRLAPKLADPETVALIDEMIELETQSRAAGCPVDVDVVFHGLQAERIAYWHAQHSQAGRLP